MENKIEILQSKGHPKICHEYTQREQRYSSTFSFTSALNRGVWLTPVPDYLIPQNDQVPIVQKAGWAGLDRCGMSHIHQESIPRPFNL